MSKLVNGVWVHRVYCNYFFSPGVCKCCDRNTDWPYPDELMGKYPGKSFEEAVELEVKEKWPDAIKVR